MNSTNNAVDTHQRTDSAWIITVFAGVMAALHIWKLPAAIPVLQEELQISLFLSGVLLGVVQVAGMVGGLAMSLLAEIYSQRKIMLLGLILLVCGSILGSFSPSTGMLLGTRIIEGAGVIMCSVMGPGLVRAHAPLKRMNLAVGWWAAFMGIATFFGILGTAISLQFISWQTWWFILGLLTLVPIALILKFVSATDPGGGSSTKSAFRKIAVTASSGRVWVSGLIFGCYTVQWMAIVGFLPTIFREDGLSPILGGIILGCSRRAERPRGNHHRSAAATWHRRQALVVGLICDHGRDGRADFRDRLPENSGPRSGAVCGTVLLMRCRGSCHDDSLGDGSGAGRRLGPSGHGPDAADL